MPAWFIYMFSEEGEDKAWPTKQMTRGFRRKLGYIETWFEWECYGGKCGSTFAFCRANDGTVSAYKRPEPEVQVNPGRWSSRQPLPDAENTAALKILCTKKLEALTERLEHAAKKESGVSPVMKRK